MNDTSIVDLELFNELTAGQKDLQKRLCALFISSVEEGITALETFCEDGKETEWKEKTHALKGAASNLGATKLQQVLKEANIRELNASERRTFLASIKSEYQQVKDFLSTHIL